MSPTNRPTTQPPTLAPTTAQPTYWPTEAPSPSPSHLPTIPIIKYYAVYSTGICTAKDVFTPSWMSEADFFLDYRECCENSWNTDACLAAMPPGACCTPPPTRRPSRFPTSKPSTSEPTPHPVEESACPAALWHPSDNFSKCTNR